MKWPNFSKKPTVEVGIDGTRIWRLNGQRHRTDGPAFEFADGTRDWWLNGQEYTFQGWLDKMNFDEHTRLLMILKYGT